MERAFEGALSGAPPSRKSLCVSPHSRSHSHARCAAAPTPTQGDTPALYDTLKSKMLELLELRQQLRFNLRSEDNITQLKAQVMRPPSQTAHGARPRCFAPHAFTCVPSPQSPYPQITKKIDEGNRDLKLDLIPRNAEGKVLDAATSTIIELFDVHDDVRRQRRLQGYLSRAQ